MALADSSHIATKIRILALKTLTIHSRKCSGGCTSDSDGRGENAYQVLGLRIDCTDAEIKVAFRKLAKETHPDLNHVPSARFIRILAAYEILSDPLKRAEYDSQLKLHIHAAQTTADRPKNESAYKTTPRETFRSEEMEVAEWLAWYRFTISKIALQNEVSSSSTLKEHLQNEFYAAVRAAYFGPDIESLQALPDCFEAEERSKSGIPEVLHLVSGRHLFGVVCLSDKTFMLPNESSLSTLYLHSPAIKRYIHVDNNESPNKNDKTKSDFRDNHEEKLHIEHESRYSETNTSDAYKDLELHLFGNVVARATRCPPSSVNALDKGKDSQDCISVFLETDSATCDKDVSCSADSDSRTSRRQERVLVGTIHGLGTTAPDGRCFVHNATGERTHMIILYRTLMVKHMLWYNLGQTNATCECRCTRARLPPSKFWIFEPRCENHDIGGWYVETFGCNKKGRSVPLKRHWESIYATKKARSWQETSVIQGSLHPAMYLMALAYRTLDLEASRRRKNSIMDSLANNVDLRSLSKVFHWCKSKFPFMTMF